MKKYEYSKTIRLNNIQIEILRSILSREIKPSDAILANMSEKQFTEWLLITQTLREIILKLPPE